MMMMMKMKKARRRKIHQPARKSNSVLF